MIHSFLRSVGFHNIKKTSDLYRILEDIINHPDVQYVEEDQNGNTFVECKKEFGEDFGIAEIIQIMMNFIWIIIILI